MRLHFVKSKKKKVALKDTPSISTYEPFYKTLKTFHEEIPDNLESSESNYFDNIIAQILKEKPEVKHEKVRQVVQIPYQRIEKKRKIKEQQISFKVDIIGKKGVGISTLVNNYTYNMFPDSYLDTVGVDFYLKEFSFNESGCIIQIWTHSNEVRFKALRSASLAGTNGIIIIYDLTDPISLQVIDEWSPLIRARDINIPIMILGNKLDLETHRKVSQDEIEQLLKKYNIQLSYEISALKGFNVDFAFNELLLSILENDIEDSSSKSAQITQNSTEKKEEISKSYPKKGLKRKEVKSDYDEQFNIILFGEPTINKARLKKNFLTKYSLSKSKKINGMEFEKKIVIVDNKKIFLQIWDFKDKKSFKLLLPHYSNEANGGLFIYDINDSSTLICIDDWLQILNKKVRKKHWFPVMLVGLISGLEKERQVSTEEAIQAAKSRRLIGFIECNVETGENVNTVFDALTRLVLEAK